MKGIGGIEMKEKDEILRKRDGGVDMFVEYVGKEWVRKKLRSEMREDEKDGWCKVYGKEGVDGRG